MKEYASDTVCLHELVTHGYNNLTVEYTVFTMYFITTVKIALNLESVIQKGWAVQIKQFDLHSK